MRLTDRPSEQELEVVTYWIDRKMRPWPVDAENMPLYRDTEELMPLAAEGIPDVEQGEELPERVRFWIKMLTGKENDDIQSAMIKTRTARHRVKRGGRSTRSASASIETDIDVALSSRMKVKAAVVKWEGIEDENGAPAPIADKFIDLLPGWIRDDLIDRISDISNLTEEELGE
jgi:hypothetical protein